MWFRWENKSEDFACEANEDMREKIKVLLIFSCCDAKRRCRRG